MTNQPWFILVGGFLGAGKTTLILAAARELSKRGIKPAVILNDQGDSLVDTQLARRHGFDADEVTGGCFCCNFSDLMASAQRLREFAPDVIFAEPVGSCTDIAATVLHPLREQYSQDFRLAPFTVCIDPARAAEVERPDCNPNFAYLFRQQLAEADLVCYTKSDIHENAPAGARRVSAATGQGVKEWLDEVLSGELSAGGKWLDIDYEEYARAEAALAWLNLDATLHCDPPVSPAMLLGPAFDRIAEGVEVVHLKATDYADSGFLKAALCVNGQEPVIEGELHASPATSHRILINLRAAGDPEPVRAIVEAAIAAMPGTASDVHLACFTPSPPKKPAWR